MTNDEIQVIARASAFAAANAAAEQVSASVDRRLLELAAAHERLLKTKFELVLDIDCTDEESRSKSRAAFKWLVEHHVEIEEPIGWLVEVHGHKKTAARRVGGWIVTGLFAVALYVAMMGHSIKWW